MTKMPVLTPDEREKLDANHDIYFEEIDKLPSMPYVYWECMYHISAAASGTIPHWAGMPTFQSLDLFIYLITFRVVARKKMEEVQP